MRVQHITIHCRDIVKSIAFYREVCEIEIQRDLRPMGTPIVFMADYEETTLVELVEDAEGAFEGKGISFGLGTNDAAEERERIMAAGYEVSDIISPNPNVKFFFVADPDGMQVQIVE